MTSAHMTMMSCHAIFTPFRTATCFRHLSCDFPGSFRVHAVAISLFGSRYQIPALLPSCFSHDPSCDSHDIMWNAKARADWLETYGKLYKRSRSLTSQILPDMSYQLLTVCSCKLRNSPTIQFLSFMMETVDDPQHLISRGVSHLRNAPVMPQECSCHTSVPLSPFLWWGHQWWLYWLHAPIETVKEK